MEAKDDGESKAASASAAAAAAAAANDGGYDCNICLELAQDPVVTMCGHLFCWPCLYRWLASRAGCKECPVCKSAVEPSKVVPIYGRGKGSTDPRTRPVPGVEIPNRPPGRRTEIPRDHQYQHQQPAVFPHQFGFSVFPGAATAHFGNVTLSAGFGIFPILFAFLSSWSPWWAEWEIGGAVPRTGGPPGAGVTSGGVAAGGGGGATVATGQMSQGDYVHQQEALLSRLLIFVGCFVILCLCFF